MEAKKYLQRVYNIKLNIESLKEEREVLESIAKGEAIDYKDKVQTSSKGSKEELMCKIGDLKSTINDLMMEKIELMDDTILNIYKIHDNTLETLLKLRYIDCVSWEDIAEYMDYNIRQVYRLHGNALQKMQVILDKLEKKS